MRSKVKPSLLQDICIFCSNHLQYSTLRPRPNTQYRLFRSNTKALRPPAQPTTPQPQDTYDPSYEQTSKEQPSFGRGGWGKASFSVELTPEEIALKENIQKRQLRTPEPGAEHRAPSSPPRSTRESVNPRYHRSKEHAPEFLGEETSFRVDLSWECVKCQANNHPDRDHCQNCNRTKNHLDTYQWRCPSCGWHNSPKSSRCNKCNSFHVEDGQMAQISQQWNHVSRYKQRLPPAPTPKLRRPETPDEAERRKRERKTEEERNQRLEQTKNGQYVTFRPLNLRAGSDHSKPQDLRRLPSQTERPPVASSIRRTQKERQKRVREADQERSNPRLGQTSNESETPLDRRKQVVTPLADSVSTPSYSAHVEPDPSSQSGGSSPSLTTASFGSGWGSYDQANTALTEAEKNQRPPPRHEEPVKTSSSDKNNQTDGRESSIPGGATAPSDSPETRSPQALNKSKASSTADIAWLQSIDTSYHSHRPRKSREPEARLGAFRLPKASDAPQNDISWLEATSSQPSTIAMDRDRERRFERSERKPWRSELVWKEPQPDETLPTASSYYSAANEEYAPGGHGQLTPISEEQSQVIDSPPNLASNKQPPSYYETVATPDIPEHESSIPRKYPAGSRDALSDANIAPSIHNLGIASMPYRRSRGARERRHVRYREEEDEHEFDEDREDSRQRRREQRKKEKQAQKRALPPTPVQLPQYISVGNLARALRVRVEDFSRKMRSLGFEETNSDYVLDAENAGLIAAEFNFEPIVDTTSDHQDLQGRPPANDKSLLPPRPPIVTIMGHVDHGKTTLLDYLRKSSVAASEHGGITQHIGAFSVPMPGGRQITFLDTPGHAAFLSMRQRGANVTDIVILVVAADDSVKPQTVEAIKHAQAARVPMIVAINKIDKEEKNIDRVKQDLARYGVEIEDYGGDTQVVCVSGKTGQGLDELEDAAVALADIIDMRAESDGQAEGWVLEATTKKAGRVATVLVKRGTIRRGDFIVAGSTWAKIRTLKNEAGVQVPHAGPGTPIEVDGWKDQPTAGDEVLQANSEQQAKSAVDFRLAKAEKDQMAADMNAVNEARRLEQEKRDSAESASPTPNANASAAPSRTDPQPSISNTKDAAITLPILLKADVSGSIEACLNAITSLGTPTIHPQVLRSAVGPISESDISLAASSGAQIVNFNQTTAPEMSRLAERESVKLIEENVIYRLTDLVKGALEALLPVKTEVKVLGEAEIAKSFEVGVGGRKKVWVAGCRVRNGVIGRNPKVRVLRGGEGGEVVFQGQLISLKNIKKDITEARKGMECGMSFEDWSDFKEGDQVQSLEEKEVKQHL